MKLNEAYPSWTSGEGVFSKLEQLSDYTTPWNGVIKAVALDLQYHGNHSGSKETSPLVDSLLSLNGELQLNDFKILSTVIESMYHKNWGKLWDTLSITYSALENYKMDEELKSTDTDTGTVSDEISTDYGKEVTKNSTATANQDNSVFGFNSATALPSDTQIGGNTVSETETHGGIDVNDASRTHDITRTKDDLISRRGNNGVRTNQELLEEERKTWIWQFFDVVFADIDKVLAIQIY